MAINKSFAGATIYKPGAYSTFTVANSGGSLGAADILFLVGESTIGAPGSNTGIQSFAAANLNALIATYGAGPLVDCAVAAGNPSSQTGAPSQILVWKTNQSTQASAMLTKSSSNIYQVLDLGWGAAGNNLSVIVADGDTANQKTISVSQLGGTVESLGENAAQVVMTIQYTGNGTAATMTITGASQTGKTLTTSLTGQTDGSANLSITLKNYTMAQLVAYINTQAGYTATLVTTPLSVTPSYQLDPMTATDIKTSALNVYQLQYEILNLLNTSARITAVIQTTPVVGLIDNTNGTMLSGGAQGASSNTDFSTGLANSLSEDYNAVLTCVSRDASVDIADPIQGFTDPNSTYTIASILAAENAHLILRGSVKNRKEAGGFGGYRAQTSAACYAAISSINSQYMQVCMQDCLMEDATGNLNYKHPHVTAAFAAGMRTGLDVGDPLTFKYPLMLDVGHFINPTTGVPAGDFDPAVDYDDAIMNGVLFLEKANGSFRWVVDNTTYGIDDSFVYNRGSVMSAVFYVNTTLRQVAENFFVGKKISNGAASSLKSAITTALIQLNAADVNITTSSANAPQGFNPSTFIVTISGNTATVQVEYIPVQGLDFVFYEFTLGDIQQTA